MNVRRVVWHTLEPTAMIVFDGQTYPWPRPLRDMIVNLVSGEVVTVYEPDESDALANLSQCFQLSIVENET